MAGLDALVIGRVGHDDAPAGFRVLGRGGQDRVAFGLGLLEMAQEQRGVGHVEIEAGIFLFGLAEHVPVAQRDRRIGVVEGHVHHVVDAQHIHRQTFQPIGQLARNRVTVMSAHLLEIGILADLHAVAPDLPPQAPGTQRGAFPVVFDEPDVMQVHVDADGLERAEVKLLQVGRARFDQHLILVIMLQPVGVFAISPVRRAARGLHIGRRPGPRPQRAQRGGRVKRAGPNLHVVGLHDRAAPCRPIGLQAQDDVLKAFRGGGRWHGRRP